ncbi:LPS translocon maturation chaperone LptM [Thalassotalea psychrophila]|uniref:LPS translocon maturation chaperone LptM n=1 Tax=Thalassotalea psychrophila TaxID=3065647 RepID=UPI0038637EA1
MLNKKLLVVVLSLLLCTVSSCGLKGPLYESDPVEEQKTEKSSETVSSVNKSNQ